MTSLAKLKKHPKVEVVDDERHLGNGVIVTLRQGWTFDPLQDNRVRGEDSIRGIAAAVRDATAFAGPYES